MYFIHNLFRWLIILDFIYTRGHFLTIMLVLLLVSLCCSIILEYAKKKTHYNEFIEKLFLQRKELDG